MRKRFLISTASIYFNHLYRNAAHQERKNSYTENLLGWEQKNCFLLIWRIFQQPDRHTERNWRKHRNTSKQFYGFTEKCGGGIWNSNTVVDKGRKKIKNFRSSFYKRLALRKRGDTMWQSLWEMSFVESSREVSNGRPVQMLLSLLRPSATATSGSLEQNSKLLWKSEWQGSFRGFRS